MVGTFLVNSNIVKSGITIDRKSRIETPFLIPPSLMRLVFKEEVERFSKSRDQVLTHVGGERCIYNRLSIPQSLTILGLFRDTFLFENMLITFVSISVSYFSFRSYGE